MLEWTLFFSEKSVHSLQRWYKLIETRVRGGKSRTARNKGLLWAKKLLRVKITKIQTVQNGENLWEISKCSSQGLGHDNYLIDILTKRACWHTCIQAPHMVKWSWSLHGMSFHGSPVTHLSHRKGSVQNISVFFPKFTGVRYKRIFDWAKI